MLLAMERFFLTATSSSSYGTGALSSLSVKGFISSGGYMYNARIIQYPSGWQVRVYNQLVGFHDHRPDDWFLTDPGGVRIPFTPPGTHAPG